MCALHRLKINSYTDLKVLGNGRHHPMVVILVAPRRYQSSVVLFSY